MNKFFPRDNEKEGEGCRLITIKICWLKLIVSTKKKRKRNNLNRTVKYQKMKMNSRLSQTLNWRRIRPFRFDDSNSPQISHSSIQRNGRKDFKGRRFSIREKKENQNQINSHTLKRDQIIGERLLLRLTDNWKGSSQRVHGLVIGEGVETSSSETHVFRWREIVEGEDGELKVGRRLPTAFHISIDLHPHDRGGLPKAQRWLSGGDGLLLLSCELN